MKRKQELELILGKKLMFRCSSEDYDKIVESAKRSKRTASNWMRYTLMNVIDNGGNGNV